MIEFSRLKVGTSETKDVSVKNGINEPSITGTVAGPFSVLSLKEVVGEYPKSATIYFANQYFSILESGAICTTNRGFGVLGTTNSAGKLTKLIGMPSLTITSPAEDAEYKIGASVTVTWTASNIENLDLVVESGSGLLAVENIDASLGTYTFNLTADLGTFYPNDTISISLTDCLGIASDTVNIVSIATPTMETPVDVVAGEDYDYAGTSNGAEVELFYSLAGEDDWISLGTSSVVDGDWTITGSIPDAGTYDFKVEDTTNPNGYAQVDDVVVASGSLKIQILSENCDFTPVDSIEVSSTEICILGTVANYAAGAKIGGIAVASSADKAVLKYNLETENLSWLWSESSTSKIDGYTKLKKSSDNSAVYFGKTAIGSGVTVSHYAIKILTSDGTKSERIMTGAGTDAKCTTPMCNVWVDSNYVYLAGATGGANNSSRLARVPLSNFAAGTVNEIDLLTSGITVNSANNPVHCDGDGTYIYVAFNGYDTNAPDASKYKNIVKRITISDFSTQAVVRKDYGYNGATPSTGTFGWGFVAESSSLIVTCLYDGPTGVLWLTDGTTELNTNAQKCKLKDSMLFGFTGATMNKVNTSTLAEIFSKNYTADSVNGVCTVNKLGTDYYIIGRSTGNFDGNNPDNTKSCAIIGKIDIANGNL